MANEVDTSEERVNSEWDAIEEEHGLNPEPAPEIDSEVSEEPKPVSHEDRTESVAGILGFVFSIGFGWFAPTWRVGKEEVSSLSDAWSKLLVKHLHPDIVAVFSGSGAGGLDVELGAIRATFEVVQPRMMGRKIPKPVSEKAEPEEPIIPSQSEREADSESGHNLGFN